MLPSKVTNGTRHFPFIWGNAFTANLGTVAGTHEAIGQWAADSWLIVETFTGAMDRLIDGGNNYDAALTTSLIEGVAFNLTRLSSMFSIFSEPVQYGAIVAGVAAGTYGLPTPLVIPPGEQLSCLIVNTQTYATNARFRLHLHGTRIFTL